MLTPLTSKTFLARLCEQAERYDGKADLMISNFEKAWRLTTYL